MNRWSLVAVPVLGVAVMGGVVLLGANGGGHDAPIAGEVPSSAAADGRAAPQGDGTASCTVEAAGVALPGEIRETSGIARTSDGALWTHNDGDEARLYRVTDEGALAQVVALTNAAASDIEDIDAGPCPDGAGECLYLADTGDNDGERSEVALLVLPVPGADAGEATVWRVPFRYPGGARDAEALAILPGAALVVTKGRDAPIAAFHLDLAGTPGAGSAPQVARGVAQLGSSTPASRDRVTGAAASDDGRWLALRTNDALSVHRAADFAAGRSTPVLTFDLRPLEEQQGEGVDLAADGRIWLTSEAERGGSPTLARLRCSLPE